MAAISCTIKNRSLKTPLFFINKTWHGAVHRIRNLIKTTRVAWEKRENRILPWSKKRTKPQDLQVAVLLKAICEEAFDKFDTINFTTQQQGKVQDVLKAFEDYCTPKAPLSPTSPSPQEDLLISPSGSALRL